MSSTRWVLELLGGDSHATELPEAGTLVLGSSRERAGFLVEGQGVDETHCAIGRTKEGDWAVKDLGSRYGTMLNGTRVSAARLKLGDQLVLGSRRLEVRPAAAAAPAPGSARPSDVPQRIGGYRIERLIGKGGMGAVYLAVQESLRRPVALKLLAPRLAADRDFVHRFQAEARAAAALSHPNVVVVYDVGEEAGAHYLSMEFMAGGSLEQKLAAAGPLPWKAVLTVLTDAAAGLAYAESRGIVHRDIKPANLMYSGTGTVKIADLGLATTLEEEASLGEEGGRKVFGTPHFISPEQARGEAVDQRSDLYSLGATAYRLLSGKTAFEGSTTRDILRALQNDAPRPLRELVPELPDELEQVVRRLMEKDPGARFPTAEALRRECERLRLMAEHGPAPEVGRGSRSRLAVALVLLGLGAGATWYLTRAPRADAGPDPAADPAVAGLAQPVDDSLADPGFFGNEAEPQPSEPDEEAELRAREREAGQALRELAPYLTGEQRALELERLQQRYAGTAAAEAAASELAALRALAETSAPTATPATRLDQAEAELRAAVAALGAQAPLAEVLRTIAAFRPPPELGAAFEARRAAFEAERIAALEALLGAAFEQADRLGVDGEFAALRAHLDALGPALAGLDGQPGDLARLHTLREELGQRRQRVDEQERFFERMLERRACEALGQALGPGSGLLAELGALDFAALDARLGALPPELAARPFPRALAAESVSARSALASLRTEFAGGGWRRKALLDPRSKRVREVRDVRPDGLVFDKDGALETISWREAQNDPEWWQQLFLARLAREWSDEEMRAIAALLRLVGAARGAELAREMIDPRARGTLAPAELTALAAVFDPAVNWLGGPRADAAERVVMLGEQALARRLAQALEAAQNRAWTNASAQLEGLLREGSESLLVGLLSDGREWRAAGPSGK